MAIGNNISFEELAKRKKINPVVNLLTGIQQGYTKNTQQEPTGTIQQLGRFAGGLTRGGSDVTGKLAEFATRPETLEVASRIGQLATAYEDPQISNVLGQIAGDIGAKRALKEQREAQSEIKKLELKEKKEERDFEEQQNIADRLNQLEIAKLRLQETPLDIEKRKKIEAETYLLELELVNKQNPISEEELLKKQANQEAYKTYLKTINDPKEAMFRTRMLDADKMIKKLENIKGERYLEIYNPFTESGRLLNQAKKNFATAVLRKESGASISPTEFRDVDKIYFPQFGDTKEVLRAKQLARQRQYEIQPFKKIDDTSTQETQTEEKEQTDLDVSEMTTEQLREIAND